MLKNYETDTWRVVKQQQDRPAGGTAPWISDDLFSEPKKWNQFERWGWQACPAAPMQPLLKRFVQELVGYNENMFSSSVCWCVFDRQKLSCLWRGRVVVLLSPTRQEFLEAPFQVKLKLYVCPWVQGAKCTSTGIHRVLSWSLWAELILH